MFWLIALFILTCLPKLAPFVNLSADTLTKGKASHTLLQRCSALRKVVRLRPVIRGRLFYRSHFIIFRFFLYKNHDFFFPWCQLPPNTEGSAEQSEAIGASLRTQVRICNTCILCQILHYESISFYYITVIAIFTIVQE